MAFSLCPVPPTCFFMRMNSDHGQNRNQVWEPLFLWHPQSAIWRPLLLLINALPAVWTNFIAFMYAHALSFSPFRRLNQTQQMWNMRWSLWSLLWARGLLKLRCFKCAASWWGAGGRKRGLCPPRWLVEVWPSEPLPSWDSPWGPVSQREQATAPTRGSTSAQYSGWECHSSLH